jgi:hypothetical protein
MDGRHSGRSGVAVAAAVQQTAEPAECQPDRDGRGEDVADSPGRDVESRHQPAGDQITDEAARRRAVEDDATVPDLEELGQRVRDLMAVLDHVKEPAADKPAEEDPKNQVLHPLAGDALPLGASSGQIGGDDERKKEHQPEAVNRDALGRPIGLDRDPEEDLVHRPRFLPESALR